LFRPRAGSDGLDKKGYVKEFPFKGICSVPAIVSITSVTVFMAAIIVLIGHTYPDSHPCNP
jgi:hypothetical protein